jgi:hypothetical protein
MPNEEIEASDFEANGIRTAYLINGFIRHNLTIAENDELDEWVSVNMTNQRIFENMTEGLMELHIGY